MASATVIPFPNTHSKPAPEPITIGNLYLTKAAELILSRAGKGVAAVRINVEGDVVLVDPECEFFPEAIAAPGFAGFCSERSNPAGVAEKLRAAHKSILAWLHEVSVR
jgi:hypothetical protein